MKILWTSCCGVTATVVTADELMLLPSTPPFTSSVTLNTSAETNSGELSEFSAGSCPSSSSGTSPTESLKVTTHS